MNKWLGKWWFRAWLLVYAVPPFFGALMSAIVAGLFNTPRLVTVILDDLLGPERVVVPALLSSFEHDYQADDDGVGWTEAQLPRLWSTCRQLAERLGCPPPDALHLSVEPGTNMAWCSRFATGPVRRHICLSLLDLRLLTHDEARAVIAHEIAHAGFDHSQRDDADFKLLMLMEAVAERLPYLLALPIRIAHQTYAVGMYEGKHDIEKEADRKAAQAVGRNHLASALKRICLQAPVLSRVFKLVLERALTGQRAPLRLAEAAAKIYASYDFPTLRREAAEWAQVDGDRHPKLDTRVAEVETEPSRAGVGRGAPFIDAYPELLAVEELLTKTYFPDLPQHQRSDASQLKRKALAARLKRRA